MSFIIFLYKTYNLCCLRTISEEARGDLKGLREGAGGGRHPKPYGEFVEKSRQGSQAAQQKNRRMHHHIRRFLHGV
ncbi:MAG TPA: hypothetical protein DIW34_00855 [Oribacterium sp.]|nr:hypothetical protein [Oribacterium sp.]